MPSKKKRGPVVEAPVQINPEVLQELIPGPMSAEGVESIFRQLKKALLERALNAELTHHLGYAKGELPEEKPANHRSGTTPKTVLTDEGPLALDIPRDRLGSFEPQIIGKHERRFTGFDDKIVSMYARGMSVREIQGHLREMYAVEVSPQFISEVTRRAAMNQFPILYAERFTTARG